MKTLSADASFVSRGFCNWKDAMTMFRKHEQSSCHREAVEVMITQQKVLVVCCPWKILGKETRIAVEDHVITPLFKSSRFRSQGR